MKTRRSYNKYIGFPQCERCLMEEDEKKKYLEAVGGSNKPKVVIRKI